MEIFQYQGNTVRAVLRNGEPWFVLADLCKVLGLTQVNRVKARLEDGDTQIILISDRLGRQQIASIVSEAGMYEVVIRSDKPEAAAFRRWITHEVLPAIRKHGMYATPAAAEAILADPGIMIRVLEELQAERAARAEIEAARQADAPKVVFADAVSASQSTILVGELAKILRGNGLPIGQNRLFERLREDGFLIRRQGSDWNMPTQRAMELELFQIKETAITHADGHVTVSKTPKVTGKGQAYLVNYYLREVAA